MNPVLAPEEEAFRVEVADFLGGWQQVDGFFHHEGDVEERVRALYRAMGERGWLSLSWPLDVGGGGKPPIYEFLLWDEMAYARAARSPLAAGIVAKTIVLHGSPEQRQAYLPGIAAGTLFFSLGYSEPEAGSDLASVRTRAVRDGDDYLLSGEKRWTSGGHRADYLWVLCRTGTVESHSRGLSLLIVDRRAPGVTISPIPSLDGERFNEVRFDGVRVPAANRVGNENEAWSMMIQSLATERHVQFCPKRVTRDFEDLVSWLRGSELAADAVVRARVAELAVRVAETEAVALTMLEAVGAGRPAVVEAAYNKLTGSEVCQEIARAALDFGAPEALVRGSMQEFLWRQSLCETIGGGTSEVLRSVIARNRLGLEASSRRQR
ncbi:MAG TPA: acyl-CoA dehydrogenase family protein [Candidatus Dormibacteraeota bacterium]